MRCYQFKVAEAGCPICYFEKAQILWSVNCDEAAQHYVLKESDPQRFQKLASHIKSLWKQETCNIVRCDNCSFCYSYPYVAGDDQFYELAYERSGYPSWKWEHQLTYDALKEQGENTALLEVGAGDGAFLKGIAPKLTSKENVLCTEFSDYGKQKITEYGIQCLSEDVRNLKLEKFGGRFDAVCMFQVLEHMDQLDTLFQHLNGLTRKQASLFISVPNPKLIEFAELNDGLLDMPPNHIGRWNRECFEEIGRRWGWEIAQYEIENNSLISKAMLFCKYRFWRKGQYPGTLASQVLQIKNSQFRKLMQIISIGLYGLAALTTLGALSSADLGFSQWVYFRKVSG